MLTYFHQTLRWAVLCLAAHALTTPAFSFSVPFPQGFIVYRQADTTYAVGDVDRTVLARSPNSAAVIQRALDQLQQWGGGKIDVKQGRYLINTPLRVHSQTQVSGAGKATVFMLGPDNARNEGVIFRSDSTLEVTLSDFKCVGRAAADTSAAVVFDQVGFGVIRDVYASDFSGYGFWVRRNSFMCRLESNYTSGNDVAGTFIDRTLQGRGGSFAPNKLIGCISYAEDGDAFLFYRAICQDIVGCVAYLQKGKGIYMQKSTSNLISGNRIFMGHDTGIHIESTYEMNISSNICGWNWGHNLVLDHCVWGTVSANEFIDAGGRKQPMYGILMRNGTKSVQVSANALFNWWDNQPMKGGIYEGDDCWENQITDNIINYYQDEAVVSRGDSSVAAYNLGLPHPYGSPAQGPNVPNVEPKDIKLQLSISDSRQRAEALLKTIKTQLDLP